MKYDIEKIKSLCDGNRSSAEIAEIVGCSPKYVQAQMVRYNLPRLNRGAMNGKNNHQYKTGRKILRDGYVLVSVSVDHPFARKRLDRSSAMILEHRLVMEKHLGRYLDPKEVVDHIDGCRLHNSIDNLRVFDNNADHLSHTLKGHVPKWTKSGLANMNRGNHQRKVCPPVCSYTEKKKRGEIRLQQILLAWLLLDKDSPYLLGTNYYLEQAQVAQNRFAIKQALNQLYRQWGEALLK